MNREMPTEKTLLHSKLDPELTLRFRKVREFTASLCKPLSEEDCMVSATEETSPPKWHLAHTTWFFEQFILKKFVPHYQIFSQEFEAIFNSYYQSLGVFLPKPKRNLISRPSFSEVLQYRKEIDEQVIQLLEEMQKEEQRETLNKSDAELLTRFLEIGIQHEQQHQELLLMDIKQNFYLNPLRPVYHEPSADEDEDQLDTRSGHEKPARWLSFKKQVKLIGAPHFRATFSYDNESDQHEFLVQPFLISSTLVTNGEYLEFIQAGGYARPEFWLSDGWEAVKREAWEAPLYWEKIDANWMQWTLTGLHALHRDEPLMHLSYYEAQAYAHFRHARLPTEFEWETAASTQPIGKGFLEDGVLHPEPAVWSGSLNEGGLAQIHGTLWEWTQSAYLPYPGYLPFGEGLSEYNEKFMCNQMVLRGGSCITSRSHYRVTYRNFYYPHQRWEYSGLRLAKDGYE